jgi:hypothetical protein
MIKHVFYCPFTGKTPRSDNQTQEWYDFRAEIFIRYTLECLKKQTNKDFIFWASFRPEELDNPTTGIIKEALNKSGITYLMTFRGTMMTEDRAVWHNEDLEERLSKVLPVLKTFVGNADYIYETNIDSDDTIHKSFSEIIQRKDFNYQGAFYMKDGYAYNTDGRLNEWHNPYSNQNYTIMFPRDVYFDAKKRLEYLKGLNTHEDIPKLFNAEELPKGLYCTIIHGTNISTVWDFNEKSHPFLGEPASKRILHNFL